MEKKFYRDLPEVVQSILITSEGWLVGNSVENLIKGEKVNDFDIIVPSRELFQVVVKQLHCKNNFFGLNSYGGIKVILQDIYIDIWCEELSHFLMSANSVNYVYNHKKQRLLKNEGI